MTSSTTPTTVRLNDPSQLLGAIPALLGFTPEESLVVIAHKGARRRRLGLVLRADLIPDTGESADEKEQLHKALAAQLLPPLRQQHTTALTLVVVSAKTAARHHEPFIRTLRAVFDEVNLPVLHAVWVPTVTTGAQWSCLEEDETCTGSVGSPESSPLAAAAAVSGRVTYRDREALEATIQREPRPRLDARAAMIAHRRAHPAPPDTTVVPLRPKPPQSPGRKLLEAVHAAASRLGEHAELTDADFVAVTQAFDNRRVRDVLFMVDGVAERAALRDLWSYLCRTLPDPWFIEAACQLAVAAYLDGDGALAGIAVEKARKVDPEHTFAGLMDQVLTSGIPPQTLTKALRRAATTAENILDGKRSSPWGHSVASGDRHG